MKEKYQGGVNYGIKRRRKEERAAYIMLAPALIVFLIFVGIPIILLFFCSSPNIILQILPNGAD